MSRLELINLINEVLSIHDLEYLIDMGAPVDEYEPEAEKIAEFIINNRNATLQQLADNIQIVFMCYFSKLFDFKECLAVASYIKEKLL